MPTHTFTSESVTEGHPDKMADQISDAVLDALLEKDPTSRVACETMVATGLCIITGEISTTTWVDIQKLARDTICGIGYDRNDLGYDGNACGVMVCISEQSPEVAHGVDSSLEQRRGAAESDIDKQGAGDQGMMFGYACSETDTLMPLPISLSHRLAERLAEVRKTGVIPYLRPDGKVQVTVNYEGTRPVDIETVLISTQHNPGIDRNGTIKPDLIEYVINPVLGDAFPISADRVLVNPSGQFVMGGPVADAGLTGRKIIVDTYGGMSRHGGGAFSGKDPSKVDRSASYAARWVAKNIVASGAAERCELQVAYAIGKAQPVSLMIDTFGTEETDLTRLQKAVDQVFDLRPAAIIKDLDLLRPIYLRTAAYGHFGRDIFPWEQTDRADALRSELGL